MTAAGGQRILRYMDALPTHLGALAGADIVAFGPVGVAAQLLPVTRAYHAVAEALARDRTAVLPQLGDLLRAGTPAGRVYAASLLATTDPDAPRRVWQGLTADNSPVTTMTGCIMLRTTLGAYAAEQLRSASAGPVARGWRRFWRR